MLNGVRVDLWPDESFDEVKQFWTTQHIEHRRTCPHRGVVTDVCLWQRKVKVLMIGLVGFGTNFNEALKKWKILVYV